MGIDIYMNWKGRTEAEQKAQITGFSVTSGDVGYLREAYHGGPYVTRYLVREAFEADSAEAEIPADVLRERLPVAVFLSLYREATVYGENEPNGERDFATAIANAMRDAMKGGDELEIAAHLNGEQRRACTDMIERNDLPDPARAFVDFVNLAETKEKQTGEPVSIYASY